MIEEVPKKIPYVPSENKRYEVSKDEFSRRRIEALRDIQHELQAELPIPISISVFGSLIKGKELTAETAPRTDLDFDLKFDEEALNALSEKEKLKLEKKLGTSELEIKDSLIEFIKNALKEKSDKIKGKLGLERIPQEHIFVTPVNSKSIQNAINNRMMSYTWEDKKDSVNADVRINSYFTLSIGEAVKKYRNKFLRDLFLMKDEREKEWNWDLIRESIERSERDGQIPDKIKKRFPQTIEEALKLYGIVINKK